MRQGPRPLPLHLGLAALTWLSSRAAWPLLKDGSLPWNPDLRQRAQALRDGLAGVPPETFAAVLDGTIGRRARALLEAIEGYRRHPYRRSLSDPPVLWQQGATRLLDFGDGARGVPLLLVPSLINRSYVLDLSARRSLARWLADAGLRPLLLDWGAPTAEERAFTLTDYVAGRLESALDAVLREGGGPPLLAGYCMGGLLALALALRRQSDLAGLALLATPWDFHAGNAQGSIGETGLLAFAPALEVLGELPVDAIQALFALVDPAQGLRKFLLFGQMDQAGQRAEDFVALEDWLNDGVPLAAPVARECLGAWYGGNAPASGRWRIAGHVVDPAALTLPSLCLVPARDRIVPPESALALGRAIPGCEIRRPPVGHIGMIVSNRAPGEVWQPLAAWLRAHARCGLRQVNAER